jgi:hypothetical protein
MHHRDGCCGGELRYAADIAGGDDVRGGQGDIAELAVA